MLNIDKIKVLDFKWISFQNLLVNLVKEVDSSIINYLDKLEKVI